jgi:hypothetical protein
LALKNNASNATGDDIARQDPSLTVQITRLNNGRLMNPASRARALTARPVASLSPRRVDSVVSLSASTHRFGVVLL